MNRINHPTRAERLFRLLADESRLKILLALGAQQLSVSEILQRTGLSQTLASFHLRTLREHRLVDAERRGPFVYYRLADPSLLNLLDAADRYAATFQNVLETSPSRTFQWPPWTTLCRMRPRR